jgi:CRP-like cAMP-binding protein
LDVPGRLAVWLLARARETARAAGAKDCPVIAIGRSQGELAAELGTTRSTLNRALNGFEALGLLSRQGDRILILDEEGLSVYTEQADDLS